MEAGPNRTGSIVRRQRQFCRTRCPNAFPFRQRTPIRRWSFPNSHGPMGRRNSDKFRQQFNSAPNYRQSNGHAEAAVKAVKELVDKISPSGDLDAEEFKHRLLEFRNIPGRMDCHARKWCSDTSFVRSSQPIVRRTRRVGNPSRGRGIGRGQSIRTPRHATTFAPVTSNPCQSAPTCACRIPNRSCGAIWAWSWRSDAIKHTV
jgi:hypothetical protein